MNENLNVTNYFDIKLGWVSRVGHLFS
jgi:hypothetical protein